MRRATVRVSAVPLAMPLTAVTHPMVTTGDRASMVRATKSSSPPSVSTHSRVGGGAEEEEEEEEEAGNEERAVLNPRSVVANRRWRLRNQRDRRAICRRPRGCASAGRRRVVVLG